jgi:hypothetical protein
MLPLIRIASDVRLINGQSPPALLAAVGQNLAAIRRAHSGAKPMLALPFFNGWMIGGIHKFFPISMDQFSAAGLQLEGRKSAMQMAMIHFRACLSSLQLN